MAVFSYTAINSKNVFVKGTLRGLFIKRVTAALSRQGLQVVNVKREATRQSSSVARATSRITRVDRIFFTRHLYTLLEAGVALDKTLRIAAEQSDNEKFKAVILDLYKNVQRGQSLSAALAQHPKYFSLFVRSLIRVGEQSGKLDEVLLHILEQQEKDYELATKARGAMIYPAILIATTVSIVILMMTFVVPKITGIFEESHATLPLTTRILIATSNFLHRYGLVLLPTLALALPTAFRLWSRRGRGKTQWDYLLLRIPIAGKIVREFNLARLTRSISALLKSGVSIHRALELVRDVTSHTEYQRSIQRSAQMVLRGIPLSELLKGYPSLYPPLVTRMLEVGELSGQLDRMFDRLAAYYEKSVANKLSNLTTVIEPVLLLTVGSIVGFIAVSILLPIWKFAETI
ncbi:MAG: general secretion pathway protein F [Parcubacteria group bacterium Gr01-1014_31]|nr:MAG: general secretion pathway protein F [Parcubacteria group bacterium Gr01-1014_31]